MVFVQKWPFFKFFFQAIQARKMSFMILYNEKTPFQARETRSSKSRKIDIFLKVLTHGFGQKMAIFPTFYFKAIQPRKISFMIFQNAKTLLQAIKTRSSKSRKIDIFAKGLTMVQVQKWPFFNLFFLGNIGQENVFYGILQRKIAFLGYKNIKLKKPKIDIFPWFWSNNGHFSNFFGGGQYRPGKCLLLYSRTKKRSSRL